MLKTLKPELLLLLFFSLLFLSGCGQKRALYLPEAPQSNQPESNTKDTTNSPATGNN